MKVRSPFRESDNQCQKKALRKEIDKQIAEKLDLLSLQYEYIFYWYLHDHHGFGKKRLHDMHNDIQNALDELKKYYDLGNGDDAFIWRHECENNGIHIEEWHKKCDSAVKIMSGQ